MARVGKGHCSGLTGATESIPNRAKAPRTPPAATTPSSKLRPCRCMVRKTSGASGSERSVLGQARHARERRLRCRDKASSYVVRAIGS